MSSNITIQEIVSTLNNEQFKECQIRHHTQVQCDRKRPVHRKIVAEIFTHIFIKFKKSIIELYSSCVPQGVS